MFVRNDRPVNAPDTLRDVATVRRLHRVVQRAIGRVDKFWRGTKGGGGPDAPR